jgi:1-acyl-sn-glycerol-3-phosphate acyltransferase
MSDRFYANVRLMAWPILRTWNRLRVRGLEHVPGSGPVLVVANHASYLDPAVLGRACPRKIHFFIKRAVWSTRGLNWFFRGMDSIPVAQDAADTTPLRTGLRLLGEDRVVGIFPEGGRATDGRLGPAKMGAALLATRTGCPVLPTGIRGAHAAMPPGSGWPRPRPVEVVFGEPFRLERQGGRDRMEAAAETIMGRVAGLVSPEELPTEQGP